MLTKSLKSALLPIYDNFACRYKIFEKFFGGNYLKEIYCGFLDFFNFYLMEFITFLQ